LIGHSNKISSRRLASYPERRATRTARPSPKARVDQGWLVDPQLGNRLRAATAV
jgi:hypothetical protein